MAKAAHCAVCGANVYVNDDGTCPQGHGAESLSNFYEAPDLTPADHAQLDATGPMTKNKSNRTLLIVGIIVAVIIMCGIGTCVAGVAGLSAFSSAIEESASSVESSLTTDVTSDIESDANSLMPGVDLQSELYSLTDYFYPGFEPTGYYLLGDAAVEPVEFQIIIAATDIPDFQMAFTAFRSEETAPTTDDAAWVYSADSGAVWERAGIDDAALSLYDLAGAEPILTTAESAQLMADFAAEHAASVVTVFEMGSPTTLILYGIDESELEDWDGQSTSFTSEWSLQSGTWTETSFVGVTQ